MSLQCSLMISPFYPFLTHPIPSLPFPSFPYPLDASPLSAAIKEKGCKCLCLAVDSARRATSAAASPEEFVDMLLEGEEPQLPIERAARPGASIEQQKPSKDRTASLRRHQQQSPRDSTQGGSALDMLQAQPEHRLPWKRSSHFEAQASGRDEDQAAGPLQVRPSLFLHCRPHGICVCGTRGCGGRGTVGRNGLLYTEVQVVHVNKGVSS